MTTEREQIRRVRSAEGQRNALFWVVFVIAVELLVLLAEGAVLIALAVRA